MGKWHYAPGMQRRNLLCRASALVLLLAGCGGPPTGTDDPSARDLQHAYQRVEGSWKLARFDPETPLGPPFDALVNEQLGQLELTFTRGTLTATGPGLNVNRAYEIVSASPDTASATVVDQAGVRYDFDLLFQGSEIQFVSKTSPWRGQGTLDSLGLLPNLAKSQQRPLPDGLRRNRPR